MVVRCQICHKEIYVDNVVTGQHVLCPFCGGKFSYGHESNPRYEERPTVRKTPLRRNGRTNQRGLIYPITALLIIISFFVIWFVKPTSDIESDIQLTNKRTSNDPKSIWYRGPHGAGMTNAEYREFLRRRLQHARDALRQQEVFKTKAESAGYYIFDLIYKDGQLQQLSIAKDSLLGEMRMGLSEENIVFPAWLPECDAEAIWDAFRVDWNLAVRNFESLNGGDSVLWDGQGNPVNHN